MAPPAASSDVSLPSHPAPAKTAEPVSVMTPREKSELALVDKYSSPDVYINGERDTCWYPWHDNDKLEVKPLRFDTQTGTFTVGMRSSADTWLGRHRHRGNVTAVTLKGEWSYKEYVSS